MLDVRAGAAGLALLAILGSSSYFYAWTIAGNPVLPLMNDVFDSPYFNGAFKDLRWHEGIGPLLPWQLTFDTSLYLEAFPGGGGFVLVGLAGAWLVALAQRGTRTVAALALTMLLVPLLVTQYLRYVYPALVLALPALVVAACGAAPRSAHLLLAATCVANLLFQANAHWMLRTGAVKESVVVAGRDAPVFAEYAVERLVTAQIRERWAAEGSRSGAVLALALDVPLLAELGSAARTVSWYDPSLEAEAHIANADASGAAWVELWRREEIADLVLRTDRLLPAQRAGLALAGARREAAAGNVEWWRLPMASSDADAPRTESAR